MQSPTTLEESLADQFQQTLIPESTLPVTSPQNDEELKAVVRDIVGIEIPDKAVCKGHVAPFQAFADAYFARADVTVWKASRGFGGKSVLLATLGHVESMFLGASVSILGGSGEQAGRVHAYITGEESNLPDTFWKHERAPRRMLVSDPTQRQTRLSNGGRLYVLMASSKSVRGPHPQRLRIDEVDECDYNIYQAAMGQPMEARGIMEQTVLSSTHQYAAGTMTEVLKEAKRKGWPVYEWCYKEAVQLWLSIAQVERKKAAVTKAMWDVEYELQTPNPGARAIDPDSVERMFDKSLGDVDGELGKYYEFEPPVSNATYCTGGDWARKVDNTVIITWRTDVSPARLVAFERRQKQPWPIMVDRLNIRKNRYGGEAAHDATGLGDVVNDYLLVEVEPIIMTGRPRSELLNNYITAIEQGNLISPYIDYMYGEHLYASVEDVYSGGVSHHLPDTISAGALGWLMEDKTIDWSQTEGLGHVDGYVEESQWR